MRVLAVTSRSDRAEAELLARLARRGVELEVLCAPDAPYAGVIAAAGAKVVPISVRSRFDRRATRAIRQRLLGNRPDILHIFKTNKHIACALRAARGVDCRVVLYRGVVGNLSYYDPTCWQTFLNARVDRIVCVSDAVRHYVTGLRGFGRRFPAHKAVRIHKGHDPAWYSGPPADLSELSLPSDAFVVCTVANWRPGKGVEVALDALRRLPEDVHWLLVGRADRRALAKRLAGQPGAERLHALGYRDDAAAFIRAAHAFVLPSLMEGLPRVVIEAMAAGIPPVVTDAGGSPELVEEEHSGLVVSPGDAGALAGAVERLRGDPALRHGLGDNARARIAGSFHVDRSVDRTLALYAELVGVSAGRALSA